MFNVPNPPNVDVVNPQTLQVASESAGRAARSLSDVNQRAHEREMQKRDLAAKQKMQNQAILADSLNNAFNQVNRSVETAAGLKWRSQEAEKDRTWQAGQVTEGRKYYEEQQNKQRQLDQYDADWERRMGEDYDLSGVTNTDYALSRSELDSIRSIRGMMGAQAYQDQYQQTNDPMVLYGLAAKELSQRLGMPVSPNQVAEFDRRRQAGQNPTAGPGTPTTQPTGGPVQGPDLFTDGNLPQAPQGSGVPRDVTGQRRPTGGPSRGYLRQMESMRKTGEEWAQRPVTEPTNWEAYTDDSLANGQGLSGILNRVATSGTETDQLRATVMGNFLEGFQKRPTSPKDLTQPLPTMEAAEPAMDHLLGLRDHLSSQFDRRRVSADEAVQLKDAIGQIDNAVGNYLRTQGKAQSVPRKVAADLENAYQLWSRTDLSLQEKLRLVGDLENQHFQKLERMIRFRQERGPAYRQDRLAVERGLDAQYQAAFQKGDTNLLLRLDEQRAKALSDLRQRYRTELDGWLNSGQAPVETVPSEAQGPEPVISDDLWRD